jgi:colanic acid biosynthesis glycosyl transferase WcaI
LTKDFLLSHKMTGVTLNKQLGQLNVPSKTYSIMASARPVLAGVPENSEITRLVHEADCGVVVPPEDPKAMAEAIQDLAKQPDLLERLGSNGRDYVVANFSCPMLVKRYHQVLYEVACEKIH